MPEFLCSKPGEASNPEVTEPLCNLTWKNSKFVWGTEQAWAFSELQKCLCSDDVIVPYDTQLPTRLYVDSSPVGTQAAIAQKHQINNEDHWSPVNYTSRPWTAAEAGYPQIEHESNGILTGIYMNRMYTLGTHVEVVTDHKPLIPVYNDPRTPKQLRVDKHRTKLLPFCYSVTYEPGNQTPCSYCSQHPPSRGEFTETEKSLWAVEDESDILVNRVIEDLLPEAITIDKLRYATASDPKLSLLKEDILSSKYCRNELPQYKQIFEELSYINGVIMRRNRIVIPDSLQADCIAIPHEAHQGAFKTLGYLRESCWFPNVKKLVDEYVETCIPCLASVPNTCPEPLKPNFLPDRPWQKLHADFKGPIGSKYYLHVLIDQFSKYPEVNVISSTSFSKLEPRLDRILATHGVPDESNH